jgi:metal-sulfur cluster biosynthetic enzyme
VNQPTMSSSATTDDVLAALGDVIGPDLGSNVVNLGFVYDVGLDDERIATLTMPLTSPACPLTAVIEDQLRTALVAPGLVRDYRVNWVFTPPWTPAPITEDGREQLRAIGFSL